MSVVFSGAQARTIENTVETILRVFLEAKLADAALPYQAGMQAFGGAEVLTADQEETRAEQNGPPYIVLNKIRVEKEPTDELVDDGVGGVLLKKGMFRVFTYRAECVANEYTGALVGIENPIAAEEILSGFLETIIDEGFDELSALGLEEADIAPEGEDQEDEALNRINSHLISFAVTSVNS